jgi:hypothetical protein
MVKNIMMREDYFRNDYKEKQCSLFNASIDVVGNIKHNFF